MKTKFKKFNEEYVDSNDFKVWNEKMGRNVVFENDFIFITVNNLDNATNVILWNRDGKKVGTMSVGSERFVNGKIFRMMDYIQIDEKYRGYKYSFLMYNIMLKYLREDINGISSYLPNRSNNKQIPLIYKRLNGYTDGGDYAYIEKKKNYENKI